MSHSDPFFKLIGSSSEAMAECMMAFQMAGEKATKAAEEYEALVKHCKSVGLPHENYEHIALTFRNIEEFHRDYINQMGDTVSICMAIAEVCK